MVAIIEACTSQAQMAVTIDGKPQNVIFQCGKLNNHLGAHEVYISWTDPEKTVTEDAISQEG